MPHQALRSGQAAADGAQRLEFGSLRIDPELVLSLLKYGRHRPVPRAVREVARRVAEMAQALVEPSAWVTRGIVVRAEPEGRVVLAAPGGSVEFEGRALSRTLAGAREAVLAVLTIGPRLERRAGEIAASGDPLGGLLLDVAGWAAIEAMVKALREHLSVEARGRGFRLTARMAPGLSGWPLEQQRELLGALEAAGAGGTSNDPDGFVRLNEASMMIPAKSVTALYGLVALQR